MRFHSTSTSATHSALATRFTLATRFIQGTNTGSRPPGCFCHPAVQQREGCKVHRAAAHLLRVPQDSCRPGARRPESAQRRSSSMRGLPSCSSLNRPLPLLRRPARIV